MIILQCSRGAAKVKGPQHPSDSLTCHGDKKIQVDVPLGSRKMLICGPISAATLATACAAGTPRAQLVL